MQTINTIIRQLSQDVFLVFNALDECPVQSQNVSRTDSLECLEELIACGCNNVHILATSRREVDIEAALANLATHRIAVEAQFEEDVSLLVTTQLESACLKRWHRDKRENQGALARE